MRSEVDDALVARIYDAAVQPATWPDLLAALADRVGGHSAWLSRLDVRTGNGFGLTSRIDPEMPQLYRQYYGGINPIAKPTDPERFIRMWRPGVLTDEDRMSKDDLVRSEFYSGFLRPQDVHSTLMIRLSVSGMETTVINIHRGRAREQFQPREVQEMQRLRGHLARALTLTDRIAAIDAGAQDAAALIDRSPDPMIILMPNGRLHHANPAAARLFRERQDLRSSGGFLHARLPTDDRTLQALIGVAARVEGRRGGELRLSSRAEEPALSISIMPLRPERISIFDGASWILVRVSGFFSARTQVPAIDLAGLFGLSAAEARVAACLLDQRTPAEIAGDLGLSVHTIRAHLARMYAKTGARRQSELVGLLMNAVGVVWR